MSESIDVWRFVAGLGLFLFSMNFLEKSMGQIAGKKFKIFFKKYTSNRIMAVLNGLLATAVLQSSTIVMLIVIAFAGAGIIGLSNSLGIILGANLGTTLTGWIVTTIGFNTNLEGMIFPIMGIGSIGFIATKKENTFNSVSGILVAFGLLFIGLGFMKSSMIEFATVVDLSSLEAFGVLAFFLFGFIFTALIHSSSAMLTITLSALFTNMLSIESAAAVIIGADLGTTMTALVSSMKGSPVKKRVGLAHFLFNFGTALLALLLRLPLLRFIKNTMSINNELYILTTFYSGFNFVSTFLFLPFLGPFERLLNRFFVEREEQICVFISKVSTEVPDASLEAIRLEMRIFGRNVLDFNGSIFGFISQEATKNLGILKIFFSEKDVSAEYEKLKRMEGELLDYFSALQREKLDPGEPELLNRYVLSLRHGVQAAKSAKDIQHNLREFNQSIDGLVEKFISEVHREYGAIHLKAENLWQVSNKDFILEELISLSLENETALRELNDWIYKMSHFNSDSGLHRATFLNVNREIFNSYRYLIESMNDIFNP
jgi:phosphate:Na+ symporter